MEAIAGVAIGGLFGLLLGLSTSPVLQGVLSALITLLGGFLIVNKHKGAELEAAKVTGFSLGCAVFVVLGIFIRTSGLVSGSDIVDRYRQLKTIGYTDADARKLAVSVGTDAASQLQAKAKTGGLLSAADAQNCEDSNPSRISDLQDELKTFRAAKGDWKTFADKVGSSNLADAQQSDLLKLFWSAKCEVSGNQ